MQLPDSKAVKNKYSIVMDKDDNPEIVEGKREDAIFSGTYEECQAEILMSLMLD
ncbi:MAG: hypothetical protein V7L25_09640 [Nostoc sp.]|uniref:hypothetical protein n=1 Tax=Nostoc sp. TaxID=1180 RepID=UPI002FF0011E